MGVRTEASRGRGSHDSILGRPKKLGRKAPKTSRAVRRRTRYPGVVKEGQHPTLDRGLVYRCMLVGFDDASAKTCTRAVSPLAAIRVRDIRDACTRMAEIHPLIVLLSEQTTAAELAEVNELASACGAELMTVPLPLVDGSSLGLRILDALRKSEARRVPR